MRAAFVIGCSRYDDADIADLRHAHRDAARFAELLRTTCGLGDDEIFELHDDHPDPRHAPTRPNILRQIARGGRTAPAIEVLFFFFSGHGFHSPATGADYLLTQDSLAAVPEENALRFDTVIRLLREWEPRHVLLFLDACRASTAGGKAVRSDELPNVDVVSLCPPGMVSFCSCEPGRSSYESDELRAGIFTAGVCEALSDSGRCRTVYELDAYLTTTVPLLSRRYDRPVQRPHTRVEPLGVQRLELVSARKRNEWRAATPIGGELRSGAVAARQPAWPRGEQLLCAFDLGTSYSVVSFLDEDGAVRLIPSPEGRRLVPSVVSFTATLDHVVGEAALDAERHRPDATIRHVKRALGTDTLYGIEGRSIAPELAASLILGSLKRNAEEYLGTRIDRCVASYPANFGIAQTNALLRAFELADLEVMRMVGEPNVATHVLAWLDPASEGDCLVVDLGGGTFDVAVVEMGEGVLELVAVAGSNRIGGLDYDEAVAAHVERELRERGIAAALTPAARRQVRREAERAKRALGSRTATSVLLQDLELDDGGLRDVELPLDRALFRQLTTDLDRQVLATIRHALADWAERRGTGPGDVRRVLLAGQGSKIFTVRETLDSLGIDAPRIDRYQETAVVHGLALQAGVLIGRVKDTLLLDVIHRSVGFRCRRPGTSFSTAFRPDDQEIERSVLAVDDAGNTRTSILVERSQTIPAKRAALAKVEGAAGRPVALRIVEAAGGHVDSDEPIGTIQLDEARPGVEIELIADVDANGTILLGVIDRDGRSARQYQLNNLYRYRRDAPAFDRRERLGWILDGCRVWPARTITDPDAAGDEAGALSIERLDVAAELEWLDGEIARLRRSTSSTPFLNQQYIGELQALKDRLLALGGRRRPRRP